MQFHLLAQQQPPLLLGRLVRQFLPPGLNGEIRLPQCDNLLAWVGVLNHEVTGVARQQRERHFALSSLADLDHFGDINEMVLDPVRTVETSHPSLLHDLLEVAVIGVPPDPREIPARSSRQTASRTSPHQTTVQLQSARLQMAR